MQSGKDTVANYLVDNYKFKRYAFADILKDIVSRKFNIERCLMDTDVGKKMYCVEHGKTVRQVLIDYGKEQRDLDEGFWVKKVIEEIEKDGFSRIVISDWRFENEYRVLKYEFNKSVYTIRINRWSKSQLNDDSETSLDKFNFDYTLTNEKDVDSLYRLVNGVVCKLLL